MTDCPSWQSVAHTFAWDGSWRDIYILDTSATDWDVVIKDLSETAGDFRLFAGGDIWVAALPSFADMLAMREQRGVTSRFSIAGIGIKCHFFAEDMIEFDLDPREVSELNWPTLCNFLFHLSQLTNKLCRLTEENCPELWWLKADAVTGRLEVFTGEPCQAI